MDHDRQALSRADSARTRKRDTSHVTMSQSSAATVPDPRGFSNRAGRLSWRSAGCGIALRRRSSTRRCDALRCAHEQSVVFRSRRRTHLLSTVPPRCRGVGRQRRRDPDRRML
ncbi:hypothetical protein BDR22DRAFT_837140 [Usnea florida]